MQRENSQIFLGYVVQTKCQQMSHAITYRIFFNDPYFELLESKGLGGNLEMLLITDPVQYVLDTLTLKTETFYLHKCIRVINSVFEDLPCFV
jgi:hypothetical protein